VSAEKLTTNATPEPAPKSDDPLAPMLVEMPAEPRSVLSPSPAGPAIKADHTAAETKEVYNLKLTEPESNSTPTSQEPKAEVHDTTALQLTIKNETQQKNSPA